MAKASDGVDDVADLLEKTKVEQLNIVSFKGKSLKLNTEGDGELTYLALNNMTSTKLAQGVKLYGSKLKNLGNKPLL